MKRSILCLVVLIFGAMLFATASTDASGNKRAVVFTKDVLPILQKHCEECHRPGGVAPMSLVSYEETRPWARAIKERVSRREMPPFHANGALGRYVGDPRLTDDEIATIGAWVDTGAPRGNAKDAPAPRQWKNDWALGTPDIIVKAKQPYTVKAGEKDQYVFFMFDYVFPEDTWISSIETRPGNPRAVHHANTHLVPPSIKVPAEGYIAGDFDPTARGTIMVAGWAPGVTPVMLPEGTAVRIPKGLRLGLQVHYAPAARETTDQTEVGIYLANGLINKNLRVLFGDRKDIEIVPGVADQSFVAKNTFQSDAVIRFMHVHMHLRGKAMVMRLTYPDGRKEDVLEVRNYNFNWQRVYILKEPLHVPKGTTVEYIGTYDNSPKNRFNPDPAKTVHWGEKTTDEMMQGRIFYEAADEKLNLWVKKGRAVAASEAASKGQ